MRELQAHPDQQAEAQERRSQHQPGARRPPAPGRQGRLERREHADRHRYRRERAVGEHALGTMLGQEHRAGRALAEPLHQQREALVLLRRGLRRPGGENRAIGGHQPDGGAGSEAGLAIELLEILAIDGDHGDPSSAPRSSSRGRLRVKRLTPVTEPGSGGPMYRSRRPFWCSWK